jgi:hypothetical protein
MQELDKLYSVSNLQMSQKNIPTFVFISARSLASLENVFRSSELAVGRRDGDASVIDSTCRDILGKREDISAGMTDLRRSVMDLERQFFIKKNYLAF